MRSMQVKSYLSTSSWYLNKLDLALANCTGAADTEIETTVMKAVDLWETGEKALVFACHRKTCRALCIQISHEIERRIKEYRVGRFHDAGLRPGPDIVEGIIEKIRKRFFDDPESTIRKAIDVALENIFEAKAEALTNSGFSLKQKEQLTSVIRWFLQVPTTLVRCFPIMDIDSIPPEKAVQQTLDYVYGSGLSLRRRIDGFINFLTYDCSNFEQEMYLDAVQHTRTGGIWVEADSGHDFATNEKSDVLANVQMITDTTSSNARCCLMRAFNTPFLPDILVCSQVVGEGIDLQMLRPRWYNYCATPPLKITKKKPTDSTFDLTLYGLTHDDFEQLDKIIIGEETEKLKVHLPENLLKAGLRVYRIMTILDNLKPIFKNQIERAAKILGYSFDQFSSMLVANSKTEIRRRIEFGKLLDHAVQDHEPLIRDFRITKNGVDKLISSRKKILVKKIDEDSSEYYAYLPVNSKKFKEARRELNLDIVDLMEIIAADPSRIRHSNELKTKFTYHRTHGLMENPLNILVFFIRHNLKRKKLKSINKRTLKFLEEQRIIDISQLDESSISKRASNKRHESYEHVYNVYRSAFWSLRTHRYDNLNKALQIAEEKHRIFSDRAENYYDQLFPEWHQIIFT